MLVQGAPPSVNGIFHRLPALTTFALAMSPGTYDGQKSMGLITLSFVVFHEQSDFDVPLWVTLLMACAISFGVACGGYRMIRMLGAKIYRIRPAHGLGSQAASATIIMASSLSGAAVSSAQVIGTSIMGVNSAGAVSAGLWLGR